MYICIQQQLISHHYENITKRIEHRTKSRISIFCTTNNRLRFIYGLVTIGLLKFSVL